MPDNPLKIAVFGESNVGKSHYGAQLIGRLNAETGMLRMRGAAPDLAAFDDVVQSLSGGVPGAHTAAGSYIETILPVVSEDHVAIDLSWPDYAGEQVSSLLDERLVPASWHQRVEAADGWILLVRPKSAPLADDIFSRPLGDLKTSRPEGFSIERSSQARLVELLQMLLYTRRSRTGKEKPALAVLLTCWDELKLPEGTKPAQVLREKLPLLANFLENNWDESDILIFGLSATGVSLTKESPNKDFIFKGAEHMGWAICNDGTQTTDLTMPIAELAKAVHD
jgi:hypothetical protein